MDIKITLILFAALCLAIVGVTIVSNSDKLTSSATPTQVKSAPKVQLERDAKQNDRMQVSQVQMGNTERRGTELVANYVIGVVQSYGVHLSNDKVNAFKKAFSETYETRILHELTLATITYSENNKAVINIPSYKEGERLQASLINTIERMLGPDISDEIFEKISRQIDQRNWFFGAYAQEIVITYSAVNKSYDIVHGIQGLSKYNNISYEMPLEYEYFDTILKSLRE